MALRKIIHVDLDAFFASVEQTDNPQLKGRPVIVGGSMKGRGVVSTASYEARKFGVHSAQPIAQARKLCPQGVFLKVRMDRYREISRRILKILSSYTPKLEPVSIDEAFLDITGCEKLFGKAEDIAREIKTRIKKEVGLSCSMGVAPNKFLAKMASDMKKPDGLVAAFNLAGQKQTELFTQHKVEKLGRAVVKIERKFGARGIRKGSTL